MSDGKLTITIDGDEAKAHAAYMALNKDQQALVKEIGKMGIVAEAAADKSIQAAKKESLERQVQIRMAESLVRANENLTQAYNRQKAALDTALASGTITGEQYKQTLDALDKKVQENSAEFLQASREKQDAANLEKAILNDHIKLAGRLVDATKSVTDKFNEQKEALDAALKAGKITADQHAKALQHISEEADEASRKIRGVGDATEQGVGRNAQEQVIAFGAKFVTAAAGVKVISDLLQQVEKDRKKALDIGFELSEARRDLRGLSGDFAEFEKRADNISLATGVRRADTRGIVFAGESQGVSASDQMLAAQVSKFADPNVAIAFMADMGDQFAKENLTGEQSLNIALTSADLSKFNPSDLLPQIQKAAIGAKVGGISSVDTAAIVGALASSFGQETGTRVSGMFSKMAASDQFKGLDGVEALRKMKGMSEEQLSEFTGSDQTLIGTLSVALQALAGPKGIEEARRKIAFQKDAAGTENSFVKAKIEKTFDKATKVGRVASLERERDISKVKDEIAVENNLSEKSLLQSIQADQDERIEREIRNNNNPLVGGHSLQARIVKWLGFRALSSLDRMQADFSGGERMMHIQVPPIDLPESTSNFQQITVPTQDAAKQRPKVMRDADGLMHAVEPGSEREREIQNSWQRDDQQQTQELRKQTSSIENQTSALVAAIERQTDAIERMNQFIGV